MYWVYRVVELFSVAYNTLRSLKLLRELQQVEDAAGTSTDACTDTTAYTNDNGTTHEQRERASSAPGAHLGRKKSREAAAAGDDADTRASETLMFWVVYGMYVKGPNVPTACHISYPVLLCNAVCGYCVSCLRGNLCFSSLF